MDMRAAIYTRISLDKEGRGEGVERQEALCKELIERNGWKWVTTHSDNSISAYNGSKRPAYESLINEVEAGSYDIIVAWAQDRLTRHPRELEDLVDSLNVHGVKVHTVQSGEYDLSTADGRAHARIVGAIARQESERKSERVRAAKRYAAAAGKNSGGQRPFGWTSSSRIDTVPSEMAELLRIKDRFLAGEGISTICIELNARGVPTATGREWSRTAVRHVLSSPANAGLRRQHDGSVVEAQWTGAWDREAWNSICALLHDPARRTTHKLRSFLLSGIVFDTEGRKLITGHNRAGRAYRTDTSISPVKNAVAVKADTVEEVVRDAVLGLTDTLELHQPVMPEHDPLLDLEAKMAMLSEMWSKDEITTAEWQAARGPLEQRIKEVRASRPKSRPTVTARWDEPGMLRKLWDTMSLKEQRTAIDDFVQRVIILPHGDGVTGRARVQIEWRER